MTCNQNMPSKSKQANILNKKISKATYKIQSMVKYPLKKPMPHKVYKCTKSWEGKTFNSKKMPCKMKSVLKCHLFKRNRYASKGSPSNLKYKTKPKRHNLLTHGWNFDKQTIEILYSDNTLQNMYSQT